MFSKKSDEWSTPQKFYDELNKEFNFTLDPCSTKENAKCEKFYTKEENGLTKPWTDEIVFCNPPYSKIKAWSEKCYKEWGNAKVVVLLIPSRTDTKYFHDYIYNFAELRFVKGRLKFGDNKNSAPFPSMIAIFKRPTKLI
jgi:site-specific DNA-methyltransferase (adenine-specific)